MQFFPAKSAVVVAESRTRSSAATKSPYTSARIAATKAAASHSPHAMFTALASLAGAAAAGQSLAGRAAESAREARRLLTEAFVKHAIPALEAMTDAMWRALGVACLAFGARGAPAPYRA